MEDEKRRTRAFSDGPTILTDTASLEIASSETDKTFATYLLFSANLGNLLHKLVRRNMYSRRKQKSEHISVKSNGCKFKILSHTLESQT